MIFAGNHFNLKLLNKYISKFSRHKAGNKYKDNSFSQNNGRINRKKESVTIIINIIYSKKFIVKLKKSSIDVSL